MGKWFSEFFQIKGHNILKYDINPDSNENGWTDFKRGLKNSSITLIATPIKTIPMILEKIIDFKYKGIVFDIASIKTYLIDSYKKALKQGLSITSIHPLFGPDTKILSDKIMCFCDIGDKSSNLKIQSLFKDTAISVFKTSIEQHDLLISYVLNLSHLINIIYVNLLSESGFDYKTLKAMGSTTFFSQIKTSKSVISEEPNLYFDIQILNKYSDEILGNFDNILDKIIKIIKDDNLSEFKKIMEKGKKWIQG
jgi:chorismate mutase/prephenate dehydrogenase